MRKRVRSAGIYVSDQQRALEFFTGTLGCELLTDEPMGPGADAPRWIEVRPNLIFHCDDIHAMHAELTARGVRFTTEPEVAPWGNRWATFCDAEGNEYGLSLESEERS